jgi:hypothetical protein
MTKADDVQVSEFVYHYSFVIEDKHLVPSSSAPRGHQNVSITYYRDKTKTQAIEGLVCTENISAFHRKLIFNLLSKVPRDKNKIEFYAKYCYIVFEKGRFLFCMDSVVSKNSNPPVVVPAQYLYELSPKHDASTIQEYLENLSKVEARLGSSEFSPFRSNNNWPFVSGFIEDDFHIEKLDTGVKFSGTGKLMRYPLGEFVGLVPIPNFGDPKTIPKHGIVVGTLAKSQRGPPRRRPTQSIRSALEELTRILWGDGGLTTWIMGQPGTGKEVFAQALHHGSGRVNNYKEIESPDPSAFQNAVEAMKLTNGFAIQSVASVTLAEFSNRLYGVSKDTNYCVVDVIDKLNGTIFLDEFDKPEKPFLLYSALLRVLEAKQYLRRTDEGEGRVKETPSTFENVNWIFAGAFTQIDPREHVPFDLWSRLKGFIHLRNPLEDEDDPDYGATLFLYWYLRLVSGILHQHGNLVPLMDAVSRDPDGRSYREHIACMLLGQKTKLGSSQSFRPSSNLLDFASHFQRLLNKKTTFSGDRLDSPRGIFKATEAAFNFLREKAFHGKALPLSIPAIRDDALAEAHKSLRLSRGPSGGVSAARQDVAARRV